MESVVAAAPPTVVPVPVKSRASVPPCRTRGPEKVLTPLRVQVLAPLFVILVMLALAAALAMTPAMVFPVELPERTRVSLADVLVLATLAIVTLAPLIGLIV